MKKTLIVAVTLFAGLFSTLRAQDTLPNTNLVFRPVSIADQSKPETNEIITQRLEEWQDLKFGFMMHWGIYAQWGVVESWSICNEPWIDRGGANYIDYMRSYQKLNKTFRPTKFDADRIARNAKDAGMKYVVFTTKHHDGFCMFNSQYTDYTCCDKSCPNGKKKESDITKQIVDAFRAKGMWTGLYFSKPDWHHPDYWAPEWATPDRNVNYDIDAHPDRWQRFCDFTYNQIYELTHNYGGIDILWLDGGWVRPEWSLNDEYREWLGCYQRVQDINMPRIAQMARENIPDLLIVDRTVHGKYENYRTPEKQIPDMPELSYPWETCMTMGDSWSWVNNDHYKTTNTLIHTLLDVVSKGGNLLLNVGPDANGALPDTALIRMKEIGKWMKINGDGIYNTRPAFPYVSGNWRFNQSKDGSKVYAFYLLEPGQNAPEVLTLPEMNRSFTSAKLLVKGTADIRKEGSQYQLYVKSRDSKEPLEHAICIVLE